MKKTIKYTDGPIGDVKVVRDILVHEMDGGKQKEREMELRMRTPR